MFVDEKQSNEALNFFALSLISGTPASLFADFISFPLFAIWTAQHANAAAKTPSIWKTGKMIYGHGGLILFLNKIYRGYPLLATMGLPSTLLYLYGKEIPHKLTDSDHFIVRFSQGIMGSALSGAVWEPVTRITYLRQAQPGLSVFGAYHSIMKTQGIRGFYRGALPNMLSYAIVDGTGFFLKPIFKSCFLQSELQKTYLDFLATFICFGLASGITAPMDATIARLKLSGSSTTSFAERNFFSAGKAIYQTRGIPGFFRGVATSMLQHGLWSLVIPSEKILCAYANAASAGS